MAAARILAELRVPPIARRTVVALAAASLLAACPGPEDEPSPPPDTVTVTETVTETLTQTPTEGTDGESLRDLIVAPQEPRTVQPGASAEFTMPGRLGGGDLPETLGFGWTPCEQVDPTGPGELTFADPNGDGHADDMSASDTGRARLVTVNGEEYENVDDEWPTLLHLQDGELTFTMTSDRPDCAVPVVFIDQDDDEEFDVAEDGTPTEVYGVGKVTWES